MSCGKRSGGMPSAGTVNGTGAAHDGILPALPRGNHEGRGSVVLQADRRHERVLPQSGQPRRQAPPMKAAISICKYCELRISRVMGVWLALDGGAGGTW